MKAENIGFPFNLGIVLSMNLVNIQFIVPWLGLCFGEMKCPKTNKHKTNIFLKNYIYSKIPLAYITGLTTAPHLQYNL